MLSLCLMLTSFFNVLQCVTSVPAVQNQVLVSASLVEKLSDLNIKNNEYKEENKFSIANIQSKLQTMSFGKWSNWFSQFFMWNGMIEMVLSAVPMFSNIFKTDLSKDLLPLLMKDDNLERLVSKFTGKNVSTDESNISSPSTSGNLWTILIIILIFNVIMILVVVNYRKTYSSLLENTKKISRKKSRKTKQTSLNKSLWRLIPQ